MIKLLILFIAVLSYPINSKVYPTIDNLHLLHTLKQSYELDYYPLTCSDNVMALGKRLVAVGINPLQLTVVFLKHKHAPHVSISAKAQRLNFREHTYLPSPWVFHAVLIFNNIVLDQDYTNHPQLITLDHYLERMWGQQQLENITFQVKPFTEYKASDFGGRFNQDRYPEINLEDFLAIFL